MPFAVENVAALFDWPDDELTEGEFLAEIVERTGACWFSTSRTSTPTLSIAGVIPGPS